MERLEEQFAILTGLWCTPAGETFSYDGHHYHLRDSPALPKPAQRPHPPLIVGGHGPKRTPRLAATYASEFNLAFSSVADTEAQYGRVRAACEVRGRDPQTLRLSAAQVVCCGADESEFERRAANIGRQPDELRRNGAAGTPDEVVARLVGVLGHRRPDGLPAGARPRRSGPPGVAGPGGPAPGGGTARLATRQQRGASAMRRSGSGRSTQFSGSRFASEPGAPPCRRTMPTGARWTSAL